MLLNGTNSSISAAITCGVTTTSAAVVYTSDGRYDVTYTATTASQACTLSVTASGVAVMGSPYSVSVAAARAAPNATVVMGASVGGVVGVPATIRIQVSMLCHVMC